MFKINNLFIYLIFFFALTVKAAEKNEKLKKSAKLAEETLEKVKELPVVEGLCSSEVVRKDISVPKFANGISPELTKERDLGPFMRSCFEGLNTHNPPRNFAEAISFSLELHEEPQENMLDKFILDTYGVSSTKDETNSTGFKWNQNVSLFNFPMCKTIDHYFIRRNENAKKERIQNATPDMNEFVETYNDLFEAYQKAIAEKKTSDELQKIKMELRKLYFALFASIAVHESLGDADNSQQQTLTKTFSSQYNLSAKYVRPKGVKLYYDKAQTNEASRYNVGLYQFTPKLGGNIDACYVAWNKVMGSKHPKCKINLHGSDSKSFEHVAASDQIFNAFCGVNKYMQSLGIQINSKAFKHPSASSMQLTHKDNMVKNKLKASKDRCITPFSHTSNSYMHFGVLGFTTYSEGLDGKPSSNTQGVLAKTLKAFNSK
jgi:hypothetical protein